MHALTNLHKGGHLYGPGGCGEMQHDPAQHLSSELIAETRELPGFSEDGVTYQSHKFWVHFLQYARVSALPALSERDAEERKRDSGVLIRVNHGGGWEVWRGDYMLAKALRRYGSDDRGMFLLCWYLIDCAHYSRQAGRDDAAKEYRTAFVEGRLKKRKLPARGQVKVWIEPKSPVAPSEVAAA